MTEIKLEILCQAAPAIFLGVHVRGLRAGTVIAGIVTGIAIFAGLQIASAWTGDARYDRPFGIHAGAWGLAGNFLLVGVLHRLNRRHSGN